VVKTEFVAAWVDELESGLEDSCPDDAMDSGDDNEKSVQMCESQSVLNEVFEEVRARIDQWQATCGQLRSLRESELVGVNEVEGDP